MFEFITKVVYINLESRTDRKEQIEKELKLYFPEDKIIRLNAVKDEFGPLGCSQSHVKVIEMCIEKDWENCLVVEDDIMWNDFEAGYKKLQELSDNPYDVIMLGATYVTMNTETSRLIKGKTTGSYLVSKKYYNTLLENLKEGCEKLKISKEPSIHAIDVYFNSLQKKDNWYLIYTALCVQRPSYSNIDSDYRDYLHLYGYVNFTNRISQIFLNDELEVPPTYLLNLSNNLRSFFPGIEHTIYTNTTMRKFIEENYNSEVLWAYDKLIPYSYKSDLGRFCILNKIGGWYFDMSIRVINNVNISEDVEFLCFRDIFKILSPWVCAGGIMYSKPNNKVLQDCISKIVQNCKDEYYGINSLCPTGPVLLGGMCAKYGSHNNFIYGSFELLTPTFINTNKAFVLPDGTILGFSKGDYSFSKLCDKGSNEYSKLCEDRMIYKKI